MQFQFVKKHCGIPKKTGTQDSLTSVTKFPLAIIEKLASEALVFLLVGTRDNWGCSIGYFLVDKITAKDQATLVIQSLEKPTKAALKVWSFTADGTTVNLHTFEILGCNFKGTL